MKSVKKTKIFVAPSLDRERQLVAYSNEVAADQETMMILPVPFPETVQFHRPLMRYRNLFRDLEMSLLRPSILARETTLSVTRSAIPNPLLEVRDIGSYRVSLAMNIDDLGRLNTDVFQLPDEIRYMLEHTYGPREMPTPYGFVCCIMRPGANKYEPIIYSHRAISGYVFVPTKHFHQHDGAAAPSIVQMGGERYAEDWDHEIYSVGTDPSEAHESSAVPKPHNEVSWRAFPDAFQYPVATPIRLWERSGMYVNRDLMFRMERVGQTRPLSSDEPTSPKSFKKLFGGLWGSFL